MRRQERTPRILFISYPSLGIMDNWLPVLWEVKKRRPEVIITMLLPRTRIVGEVDPKDTVVRICEQVVDEVIFKSRSGFWIATQSLESANMINNRIRTLQAGIRKVRMITNRFDQFLRHLSQYVTSGEYIDVSDLSSSVRTVCFDILSDPRSDGGEILKNFKNANFFTLYHGLSVNEREQFINANGNKWPKYKKILAYVFSEYAKDAYLYRYSFSDSEMKVIGVPRHTPSWIGNIVQNTEKDIPASWHDQYIFLISRRAISSFFTKNKKRQAVEAIKKLAFDGLNCKIVIKLHPVEREEKNRDTIYEEILGSDTYGEKWMYSSEHPIVIGKHCLFAVSFFSGVPMDMLAIGVPSIEMLDLSASDESKKYLHQKQYSKRGLVLPATNYEELKNHAMSILGNKPAVLEKLMINYKRFFAPIGNPIKTIADDICDSL